jgi:putative membrane protein
MTRLARWPVILRSDALRHHSQSQPSRHGSPWSLADAARYRRRSLSESIQLLNEDRLLVVFPEGYPNVDPTYTPKVNKEDFLPFKPGFVAITRGAEHRLGKTVPIIPTGLRYRAGKPWIVSVSFDAPVTRQDFSSPGELIRYCEKTIKQLSS